MTTLTPNRIISRGSIWLVNFDPTQGAEIQKIRPAVLVNVKGVGRLPLHIVVPITDWKTPYEAFPWFVRLAPSPENGLKKESGADAFQVKSLSADRFVRLLGTVTNHELNQIVSAVALCIGYTP